MGKKHSKLEKDTKDEQKKQQRNTNIKIRERSVSQPDIQSVGTIERLFQ